MEALLKNILSGEYDSGGQILLVQSNALYRTILIPTPDVTS